MGWNALIVGLGQIGMGYDLALDPKIFAYSHARALRLHPAFNLVGAVDPSEAEREVFQQSYATPAYSRLEQALEVHDPDVVVISTPTVTHCDTLRRLLTLRCPMAVLCEKPLSYNLTEARYMLDLCAEKNVSLYVNYMRRSEPGVIDVKGRIDCGEIGGDIKGVAWYSKGFLHNGSHLFNLLQFWLGDMQNFVLGDFGRDLSAGDSEPDVHVSFVKGQVIFLATKDENFSHNSIELFAANGRLRYENGGRRIDWNPACLDENLNGYTFLATNHDEIPSQLNYYQWHVAEQLANALKGSKTHLCTGSQGLATLEAMHNILKSRR